MSFPSRHDDADDGSRRGDLREAMRKVQRERALGILLSLVLVVGGAIRDGLTFRSGPEALLVGVLVALLWIYAQVCGLRIDGIERELRGLPRRL